MSNRNFILLTGATGQIGRYLLRDLLQQGQQVAVLVRGRDGAPAKQRIANVVEEWETTTGISMPMPVCLEGDTTQEGFGLSFEDRSWVIDHCDTMFHNAASIDFNGGGTGATWDNNVSSAHRTLEVCRDAKIDHLAYVSTAYVCGQRKDLIHEHELDAGQTFRNEYEHSKYEAERIVRESKAPDVITVLRPAVVVGDHATGQTNAYHSFYRLPQFTRMIAGAADKDANGHWTHDVRIALTGQERRNLVAVDWVSAAMVAIVRNSDCYGKTFHLTPKQHTTACEIEIALQRYFHYTGVKFVGRQEIDVTQGSAEEQRFYEYIGDYADYWEEDPQFDRSETDAATKNVVENRIDVDCLVRLIDYAVRSRFGRKRNRKSTNNASTTQTAQTRAV